MENQLTKDQGALLLQLARQTIKDRLQGKRQGTAPDVPEFLEKRAVFVTLKKKGQLRGCIGNLQPVGTLLEGVRDNAINAAFNDYRFEAVKPEELGEITIEVSVLTVPEPLVHKGGDDLAAKLRPGTDGVILRLGRNSATFLPQVWEQLPTAALFLGHLCTKAGLSGESWQSAEVEIETYQVESFMEGEV